MEDEVEKARREKAARLLANVSIQTDEELMLATRGYRVMASLEGTGDFPLEQVYREFVGLLRSGQELDQDLRNSIADALERGQLRTKGCVRIRIEADAGFFTGITSTNARQRLLDAGLHIEREKLKGRTYREIRDEDITRLFGVKGTQDYEDEARALYAEFQEWLELNYEKVHGWPKRNDVHFYETSFDLEADNYFCKSRTVFLLKDRPKSEWLENQEWVLPDEQL